MLDTTIESQQTEITQLFFGQTLRRNPPLPAGESARVVGAPGATVAQSALDRTLLGLLRVVVAQAAVRLQILPWPTLRAAADPTVRGGQYYGPGGFLQLRGYPKLVSSNGKSQDVAVQKRLWAVSEALTGVVYPAPG